ncbi:MAG: helix-turn-helix transcriptional regulator [Ruminococcaceae bacterium]|nr:helix-turn-helix transcriptional regulator [Oscillospiraceae bacterium]
MSDYMSRLRDLREDNDLTQQQVADVLHTSQTMYARYERRATELPLRHLIALCRLYNVSADDLLGTHPDCRRKKGVTTGRCVDDRTSGTR